MAGSEPARSDSEIGPSVVIRGDVTGEGSLRVRGRVEGKVSVRGQVTLAEESHVAGTVEAEEVVLLGLLEGTVLASRRLEIGPAATLRGDFESPRLRFHRGGRMKGRARMLPRAPGSRE